MRLRPQGWKGEGRVEPDRQEEDRVCGVWGWAPWKEQPANARLKPVRHPGAWPCLPVGMAHDPAMGCGAQELPLLTRRVWGSCHAVSWDGQALGTGHPPAGLPSQSSGSSEGQVSPLWCCW